MTARETGGHPDTATAPLQVEDRDGVRLVTLHRPEARNAFNDDLYDGVGAALSEAAGDNRIGACVVAATGPVFSAGQDLREMTRRRSREEAAAHGFVPFARTLAAFDKPLVAAVQGPAVGVGCTMLLHCDVVLASPTARFRTPFTALGIVPEAASSLLLPARLGPQTAADMLFTGRWLEAEEAVARGLVARLCPADQLIDETLTLATLIAGLSREAVVATKRLILAARADAVEAAMSRELAELTRLVRSRRQPA
jgi:enoyl-CoA hydratase/carnithine racemase